MATTVRKSKRRKKSHRPAPQPAGSQPAMAVGDWAQFDAWNDDDVGEVVFCKGGYVVIQLADGTCEGAPLSQVVRRGPTPAAVGLPREARRSVQPASASPVMFQRQLQDREPLPLMAFVERLVRMQSDLCTLVEAAGADDDFPAELLIEGRRIKVEDVVVLRRLHLRIEACVRDAFELLETGIHGTLADEWHSQQPVTPLFQTPAARQTPGPVAGRS